MPTDALGQLPASRSVTVPGRRPVASPAAGAKAQDLGLAFKAYIAFSGFMALVVGFSLFGPPVQAQESIRWGGRWELGVDTALFEKKGPDVIGLGSLRLQARTTTFPWRAFLDGRLNVRGSVTDEQKWESQGELDRLYVRYYFAAGQLSLGRQFVNWGVGYAFAPTDVFNPPDPTDPDGIRPGIVSAVGQWSVGPLDYWSIAVAENQYGLRRRGNVRGTDWAVLAVYDDGDTIIGADLDGDWGVGWHLAAAYRMPKSGARSHLTALVGADYSWLQGRLPWIGEYAFQLGGDPNFPRPQQTFQQLTYRIDEFSSVFGSVFLADLTRPGTLWTLGWRTALSSESELQLTATWRGSDDHESSPGTTPKGELQLRYSRAF